MASETLADKSPSEIAKQKIHFRQLAFNEGFMAYKIPAAIFPKSAKEKKIQTTQTPNPNPYIFLDDV
jgi:hypothetical protein